MKWQWWGLVVVLGLSLAGCGDIEPGNTKVTGAVVHGLKTAQVEEIALPEATAYVGSVESSDRSVLVARTDGRVLEFLVQEGELVKAGQQLLRIGDNASSDRLREAQAALAESQSQVASAKARVDLAETTYKRYEKLAANEAVTPQEMDRVSAELKVAREAFATAQASERRLASARDAAQQSLSYNVVAAPYAGRVIRRQVEAGSTVLPGTPLLTLDREGDWRVRADLPESLAGQVQVGDHFTVELPALGRVLEGELVDILPTADPTSRTFQVKVAVESLPGLASGQFARIRRASDQPCTLVIPQTALVVRGQLTGVYVVEKNILHYRLVKTGQQRGEYIEVLSGLTAGERVVTTGTDRARHGDRLED